MTEKLQKILARAGLGSRREIERWIDAGRVTVNGQVATLGLRAGSADSICVDGRSIQFGKTPPKTRVLLYHKPLHEICTRHDPEGRPTIFEQMPPVEGRWINIGRLDVNTTGLLLLTNNGELAHALMHPSRQIEREYKVRALGSLDQATLNEFVKGVNLEGETVTFKSIIPEGGEGSNQTYCVIVCEGRNRFIRRMFEAKGCAVNRLLRIRFAHITLPRSLLPGKWIELKGDDLNLLLKLIVQRVQ